MKRSEAIRSNKPEGDPISAIASLPFAYDAGGTTLATLGAVKVTVTSASTVGPIKSEESELSPEGISTDKMNGAVSESLMIRRFSTTSAKIPFSGRLKPVPNSASTITLYEEDVTDRVFHSSDVVH